MDERLLETLLTETVIQETSDEKAWQSPGYSIVETALEVTAYALADR
jgi:coenzyme PQQ precursor peptide PqqA